jgi:hypothetical protein
MLRRVVIVSVFLSVNALFFWGVYFVFFRVTPTCFDTRQNQNEQGIDCGGVCANACIEVAIGKDFQTKELVFVPGGTNLYDVLGKVSNDNDEIGASTFRYTFELKDGSGRVLATRSGQSFILPHQEKNLIESNLETTGVPTAVTLTYSEVVWERASGYQEVPRVSIYQKQYGQVTDGFGFSAATGLLTNESPYDFRSIVIDVIVRDSRGVPLAFNKTRQDTVKAGESRDFKLVWPTPFPGAVERIDMEVDADVYHSDNFVKQYFPGGQY